MLWRPTDTHLIIVDAIERRIASQRNKEHDAQGPDVALLAIATPLENLLINTAGGRRQYHEDQASLAG